MTQQTRGWFATRWKQLAVLGLSIVGAGALAVACAASASAADALTALLLGFVYWPLGFGKVLAASEVFAMVAVLGYWPAMGFCSYRFLVREKWAYALPTVVLMVVPALEAAEMFAISMDV